MKKFSTKDITLIAIFIAVITICSWISIPATVPFTLQTFAIFISCLLLGGRNGLVATVLYILLGAVGIPVFSGFTGGISVLLGTTGGYIIGFILTAIVMWVFEKYLPRKPIFIIISMLVGLIACYTIGTIWFMYVYTSTTSSVSLMMVLSWCVVPFIIPDLVKIALAYILSLRLKKVIK